MSVFNFRSLVQKPQIVPQTSICFVAPSIKFLDLLPPAPQPPMQKRDARHTFVQDRSGVVLANQTEESEVRELSGKESGMRSRTPFASVNTLQNHFKKGVLERIPDSFPKVREPRFLRSELPEPQNYSRTRGHTALCRGTRKPINMNNSWGLSQEWVGVNFVYVLRFAWGKRETHKQNSHEIPGKCWDSPGRMPGQSIP